MKIAILGGSFDPPHIGHVLISQQVKELLHVDQVWLMPLFEKTHQDKVFHKSLTAVDKRVAMAKFLENDFIKVSDFEITQNKDSFTIDTLNALEKKYPDDTFYWILGSDQLTSFQKYHKWEELVKKKLIIFPREHTLWHIEERVKEALGFQVIPANITVLHNRSLVLTNVSSSMIREKIKKSQSIKYLVPAGIERYIQEHRLYG